MNKLTFLSLLLIFCSCQQNPDPAQYVNPFIGNADNGHTFPGACVPFGMIQVSPESGNCSWHYCAGFKYDDDNVYGFAQNHLNGTGCLDLGDILMLPFSGEIKDGNYKSKIDKNRQEASPGYYGVHLSDFDIDVQLTATERTAFHQYTFHKDATAQLLVDLQSGLVAYPEALDEHVLYADMQTPDHQTITGHNEVRFWVQRHFYYVIRFDKPYKLKEILSAKEKEKGKKLILDFDLKPGETLKAKVAISTVSVEGATASMEKEIPDWNFEKTKTEARKKWNELLSRVEVKGNHDQKTNFYTSLYHLFIQPNNIADTDGQYRDVNDKIAVSPTGNYYSTLSLWDTYRAAHPLYTLLVSERVDGMIQSMLLHYNAQGFLPIWTLWGKENYCMIANHAIPVIVEAYLKGFRGFDPEEAYQAIKQSSLISHINSDWETYNQYGYYPFDMVEIESVSRTLESAYDDYCVAQMAKALGKTADYDYFMKRADYYHNLLDPATGLMRGKDSEGNWRTPFNPFRLSHGVTIGGDYTEANAWQYTWHVQHDIPGLLELMGKEAFINKLDTLFFIEPDKKLMGDIHDVSGLIGQYAHGNEPSHHISYLYKYAGQPHKTQELIREITDRFYLNRPDGLCGNDDCGQMSAWYVFSAMGFYPVNPISGEYIIGAPQVEEVTLHLADNKTFTVKANGLSQENKYVQSVTFNGKPIYDFTIQHQDILNGGMLEFTMTDKPFY